MLGQSSRKRSDSSGRQRWGLCWGQAQCSRGWLRTCALVFAYSGYTGADHSDPLRWHPTRGPADTYFSYTTCEESAIEHQCRECIGSQTSASCLACRNSQKMAIQELAIEYCKEHAVSAKALPRRAPLPSASTAPTTRNGSAALSPASTAPTTHAQRLSCTVVRLG